jgi:hypothetical protein
MGRHLMARRLMVLLAALAALAALTGGVVVQPAAAGTSTVTSHFQIFGGRSQATTHTCDTDLYDLCAVGTFDGTAATSTIVHDDGVFLDSSCVLYLVEETVTLADGTGSVLLDHEATLCAPTVNWWKNRGYGSFGNPFSVESTWTVRTGSGTGIYAGATGGGTWTAFFAGESGFASHTGSITTP